MTVYVNGVDLYYEKSGEGRPLIMIHGYGEDHGIFDEAAAVLKDRFAGKYPARKAFTSDFIRDGIRFQIDAIAYKA